MLRNLTVILFLFAFTANTFNKGIILLNYQLNTSAYAKNCENKAKPVMKCHGKCQMMKQMKAEEKKDEQNQERKLENKVESISSRSFFAHYHSPLISAVLSFSRFSLQLLPTAEPKDIFHPPLLV